MGDYNGTKYTSEFIVLCEDYAEKMMEYISILLLREVMDGQGIAQNPQIKGLQKRKIEINLQMIVVNQSNYKNLFNGVNLVKIGHFLMKFVKICKFWGKK